MKKAIKSNGAINYCLTTLDTSGRTLEKERGRDRKKSGRKHLRFVGERKTRRVTIHKLLL